MRSLRCVCGRRGAIGRRGALLGVAAWALPLRPFAQAAGAARAPERRFIDAAFAMKRLAESWGDQPYGAVLVLDGRIVGEGPSRVILRRDAAAHAEREAMRDAQQHLGRTSLAGSVLYSTSRPCAACEAVAHLLHVDRMIHGEAMVDAGPPGG